jgi:hypothetical protein
VLKIFEKGISYKKKSALWEEIDKIEKDNKGYEIVRADGEKITLSGTLYEIDAAARYIEAKILRR